MLRRVLLGCCLSLLCGPTRGSANENAPTAIPSIAKMPDLPQPFVLRDWKQVARDFDRIVFDASRQGPHLPLIWWDPSRKVNNVDGFAIPTYVGDERQDPTSQVHEGITSLAAVLGATLAGIDKSDQHGRNYVSMLPIHYHQKDGIGLYLNHPDTRGDSYWYDLLPSLLFYQIYARYPQTPGFQEQFVSTADVWRDVSIRLGASETTLPVFDHTGFDFLAKKPVRRGWQEPDAAAGIACLEYLAYRVTKDEKYLEAADWALRWLQERKENPFYECLLPYGAYAAARSNAERGTAYDTARLIEWVLAGDNPRKWGAILERWNKTDAFGLIGSVYPEYEYAFAMNSFQAVGVMAPIARYEPQYARDLAKWILNVVVNGRHFYPNAWPSDRQSSYDWASKCDPTFSIPYEGLRKQGTTRNYPNDDRVVYGSLIPETHRESGKKLTLQADEKGRIGYRGNLAVPPGSSHTLMAVIPHRKGWMSNSVTITVAETENGPAREKLTCRATDDSQLRQIPIGREGDLWIRIDGREFSPSARIEIEDILIETRFRDPPHAGGDATVHGWAKTDLGLYGGANAGFLAALVEPTNVGGIVAIDPVATDMLAPRAYPTRLLFNPFQEARDVKLNVGADQVDVYDSLNNQLVARAVSGTHSFCVPGKAAVMLVMCPSGKKWQRKGTTLSCDGIVIDYQPAANTR